MEGDGVSVCDRGERRWADGRTRDEVVENGGGGGGRDVDADDLRDFAHPRRLKYGTGSGRGHSCR